MKPNSHERKILDFFYECILDDECVFTSAAKTAKHFDLLSTKYINVLHSWEGYKMPLLSIPTVTTIETTRESFIGDSRVSLYEFDSNYYLSSYKEAREFISSVDGYWNLPDNPKTFIIESLTIGHDTVTSVTTELDFSEYYDKITS
jgi:GR25 family glycosyltransferase involved in LPS biosynthesis